MRACTPGRSGCRSGLPPGGSWRTPPSTRSRIARWSACRGWERVCSLGSFRLASAPSAGFSCWDGFTMSAPAILETLRALSSLSSPPLCVVCSSNIEGRDYLCDDCRSRAPRIKPPFCAKCSEPFSGAITQTFSCANCEHRLLHFDAAVAAYRSRGLVRKLVHDFKYGRQRHLRHPLAAWLREALHDPRLHGRRFDLLVPV